MEAAKPGQPAETTFSHVKEGDTVFKSDGLRDFFLYRDLGIAKATGGKVIATLVRANKPKPGANWLHRVHMLGRGNPSGVQSQRVVYRLKSSFG